MREKQKKFVLNKAQEEQHKRIVKAIRLSMKQEKINMSEMNFISDVTPSSLTGFLSKNRPISSFCLIKIAEALGFEVTISKRADAVNPKENVALQTKINEEREKRKIYARNKRGYKGVREKGRKKKSPSGNSYLIAQSRKQQLEEHRRDENDFLSSF